MRMWWKAEREREWSPGWDCPRIPDQRPPPPACMEISYLKQTSGWKGQQVMLHERKGSNNRIKKTSLICYFLRLAKAKCGAFDIAVPQTILLSFAIQSQLSDSDSSDAPRTLWLLMAIHAKSPTNQYFFFIIFFRKRISYFQKSLLVLLMVPVGAKLLRTKFKRVWNSCLTVNKKNSPT